MSGSAEAGVTAEPFPRYDVAAVGAGQAGLAMGYYLKNQGRHFVTT